MRPNAQGARTAMQIAHAEAGVNIPGEAVHRAQLATSRRSFPHPRCSSSIAGARRGHHPRPRHSFQPPKPFPTTHARLSTDPAAFNERRPSTSKASQSTADNQSEQPPSYGRRHPKHRCQQHRPSFQHPRHSRQPPTKARDIPSITFNSPGQAFNSQGTAINIPGAALNIPSTAFNSPGAAVNMPGMACKDARFTMHKTKLHGVPRSPPSMRFSALGDPQMLHVVGNKLGIT